DVGAVLEDGVVEQDAALAVQLVVEERAPGAVRVGDGLLPPHAAAEADEDDARPAVRVGGQDAAVRGDDLRAGVGRGLVRVGRAEWPGADGQAGGEGPEAGGGLQKAS